MADVDISTAWRDASRIHHIQTVEGRTVVFDERTEGLRFTNELGDTWFLPHVVGVSGSADILVAGRRFRPVPA